MLNGPEHEKIHFLGLVKVNCMLIPTLLAEALLSSKIPSQAENHLLMSVTLHGEKKYCLFLFFLDLSFLVPNAFFMCVYFSF